MRNRVIHLAACLALGAATTAFFVGCDRGADSAGSGSGASSGAGA